MNLTERSYLVDHLGTQQRVIEDQPLLAWAKENLAPPPVAQLEALRNGIIPLRYQKNLQALTLDEQIRVCASRVIVCGCGGLGGIVIQLLARAGVGWLRLVDGDLFAPSNLNRQLLCDVQTLSRPKAQVAAERVSAVNPLIAVEAFNEVMDQENMEALLQGMDLVLDALDNLPTRFLLGEGARRMKIPFIHAGVAGFWGQVSTFLPESRVSLRSIYGNQRGRDPEEESMGVLGPAAAVIGSLEAFEALRLLWGREPAYRDRLLYFDGESGTMNTIPLEPESVA